MVISNPESVFIRFAKLKSSIFSYLCFLSSSVTMKIQNILSSHDIKSFYFPKYKNLIDFSITVSNAQSTMPSR